MKKLRLLLLLLPLSLGLGCGYRGSARAFDAGEFDRTPGWVAVRSVPLVRQEAEEDCGAAAIAMVLRHWDRDPDRARILAACPLDPGKGILARDLRDYARTQGLRAYLIHGELQDLAFELGRGRPLIVGLIKAFSSGNRSHYEVVVGYHPESREVVTLDPAGGWRRNSAEGFLREWDPGRRVTIVIFRDP